MPKLKESQITVVIDTREQTPLALERYGFKTVRDTLPFGDYTLRIPDMQSDLAIERKSLPDFVMCCGRERDRFEKELLAMRGYRYRYIVGEFGIRDILSKNYRSQINPNSVLASIAKWSGIYGIHFLFCDHAPGAAYVVSRLLYFLARMETVNAINLVLPIWAQEEAEKQSFLDRS